MRRLILLLIVLAAAGGGGGYWWLHQRAPSDSTASPAPGARRRFAPPDSIPVLLATAEKKDVPIWLDGLGTVQASASVVVRPMVDGPLVEVRFREGQDVAVGDVLARIDSRTYQAALDQALARKQLNEATLANARLDAARYAKLAATAYTSAQQADTARTQVAQLEAQVASDQAQIDNARTLLSYTTITAPIAGRVGIRAVDAGNIVRASDPNGLVTIATLRPINVQFTLPQQALEAVQAAMAAGEVEVVALPQANAPVSERAALDRGRLTVLDNQVDPATGTIRMKASFANEQLQLWPGAFVTVRLRARIWHDATTVPPVAVQRGPRGAFVFVVGDDLKAARRPVAVGHEDLTVAVIGEGVQPGERVVVDGASRLSDGTKVTITPPPPPVTRPLAGGRARAPG
ncbi:MAG: efflux RND transporter periplasmic adaptor subunit [Acetobacteraceae bacterium]|nr:efflux RND transporter periplasmic adaptor subunit [Acetobacteraceae bacterium]